LIVKAYLAVWSATGTSLSIAACGIRAKSNTPVVTFDASMSAGLTIPSSFSALKLATHIGKVFLGKSFHV
jgi:hypothetical protein